MKQHWQEAVIFELVVMIAGISALTAKQSSTWNDSTPNLAVDTSSSTCSSTGFGSANWLTIDLGTVVSIRAITINGSSTTVNVRLGLNSDDAGVQGGFDHNQLCVTIMDGLKYGSETYHCSHTVNGRYLSIQGVDPNKIDKLIVCAFSLVLAAA